MKRLELMLTLTLVVAFAGPAALAQEATRGSGDSVEIKVMAKRFEYDPNVITVKKGNHVRLLITAADHDHGFKLAAFNIDQLIEKGSTATIEFTASKAGTFPFQCSHFCGMGHGKMKGKLVVQE
ncbi:MAG: cupredoxin domain-containing protein [Terriglobia bacterium]